MASAAPEVAATVPTVQKKARPNPGRRKAFKVTANAKVSKDAVRTSDNVNAQSGQLAAQAKLDAQFRVPKTPVIPRKATKDDTAKDVVPPKLPASSDSKSDSKADDKGKNEKPAGSLALATPALVTGGLIGCAAGAAVLLGAGLWRNVGGVDSAILAVRTAKLCMNNLCEEVITSLRASTYNTPEALDMLRRTTLAYASAIPGGAPAVERIFREIDMVRRQRGREVDKVVMETYTELSRAGSRSAGPVEMQAIILRNLTKLSTFAANASQDVLARNPKLEPLQDGAARALKQPTPSKVPTVKLNMSIQQRPAVAA